MKTPMDNWDRNAVNKRAIYLFIYGLFNATVSCSEYTASNGTVTSNYLYELERVWKEEVVANFKLSLLFLHSPGAGGGAEN
jgi:hypothetical protein